ASRHTAPHSGDAPRRTRTQGAGTASAQWAGQWPYARGRKGSRAGAVGDRWVSAVGSGQGARQDGPTRASGGQRNRERRHCDEPVRKCQQQKHEVKPADEQAVNRIWRGEGVEKVDQETPEDEHKRLRDDLVERVLEQRPEPAPEDP